MMVLNTDRFIASAISFVRIAPDAPTRAPAMIRTSLPSTKPAIAMAVPVKLLSRLMTTGIAAPPIGSTIVSPKPPEATTDGDAGKDDDPGTDAGLPAAREQHGGSADRQGHAPGGDQVAVACGRGRVHAHQAEHEPGGADELGNADQRFERIHRQAFGSAAAAPAFG